MACNTETKQIGDSEYSVTQWPASKSILMKLKLVKSFGPSLTSLMSAFSEDKKKQKDQEAAAISKALEILFQSTTPEELLKLIESSVIGVAKDGTRITESSFNEHFSGDNLMDVYKVFIFTLQVNYSNLFKGQLADRFLAKMKEHL
jgi:hypothetical protein